MKRIRQFQCPHTKSEHFHNYTRIDRRLLQIGDYIDFTLYVLDDMHHINLFMQGDTVIDSSVKELLWSVEELYVSDMEKTKFDQFVEKHIQNILQNETLTLDDKTEVIYFAATEMIKTLYDNPNGLENVKRSKEIITPVIESIIHNQNTISSYIKVISYDYYTHTHSLNVSIYALCLGNELSLSENSLQELGEAALLHDLGKSKIAHSIVEKNGQLTSSEFEEMKKHPTYGYEIATDFGIKNSKILDGILHHHEKLNGKGYPDGLKADQISLFARVIAVCDVFDALTTRRSYKNAMRSYDALYLMKIEMHHELDVDIINVFIKMLRD